MWLAVPILIIVVLALLGGLAAGGVYAAVLIPIAAIILLVAMITSLWRRATGEGEDPRERRRTEVPLPHTSPQNTPATPATPDQIVDARREAQ
ncbi:MAG: hypothetical protein JOZ07_05820 [Solirubrobacterales bacterium]|nr:hypothetical protein [Solirubrobacterales bacterium]